MSQTPSSNAGLHDIIMEESPPAYTPYPNSGEQSMAFGPNRPFGNNATQNTPQQQQNNYQTTSNQNTYQPQPQFHQPQFHQPQFHQPQFRQPQFHQPPLHQPLLQNYNPQYHGYNNNLSHGVTRPINTAIPINTQVITTPFRYITNQINQFASTRVNNDFVQMVRPQNNVIYVKPGDSSIGGFLCPKCQGLGKLSNKQLCNKCQGIGRLFN
ncbi:hypothetical protein RhiirA5_504031 [Rhizophagus irregularis]|uniref:Uncharacterized protein n=2 Tax=Rhizophagus irregularis TaxID=588596 RepID=A0A2N0P6H7_9GLOM|nr:hypothetical protein RhiirA5_504031 [Rhizophagus irregularis]CAB4475232.1 unnamed protein product [Rhizophagus irregularis]CAB5150244.1 unnamed protein product [Rhizophagus irregularis]CAB5330357.1 unnamed protein product [Rhizophagus irregularis]